MSLRSFIVEQVRRRLANRQIVVWFDSEGSFSELIDGFRKDEGVNVLDGRDSVYEARRKTDQTLMALTSAEPGNPDRDVRLLIYLPYARAASFDVGKRDDPFEAYAIMGASFGDDPSHTLQSLARQAMPDLAAEIDRLFAESKPTLQVLEGLRKGQSYPTLKATFQSESAVEIAARILGDESSAGLLDKTAGAASEFARACLTELGFESDDPEKLAGWLLVSELAHDLPDGLPEALSAVKVAPERYRSSITSCCDRMRKHKDWSEGYMSWANRVEHSYHLKQAFEGHRETGQIDTFSFEDSLRLGSVALSAASGDLDAAEVSLRQVAGSIWREQPERTLQWGVAESAVRFLRRLAEVQSDWTAQATSVKAMVNAYVREKGWAEVDRAQRLFEQAAANAPVHEALQPLLDTCRSRYWDWAGAVAQRFQSLVATEGWPPEGIERQQRFFVKHLEPLIASGEHIAWFVVDSLRFEMGRDLQTGLVGKADAKLEPMVTALPTSTPFCMAALLPGAETGWCIRDGVPCIGHRALPDLDKRKALLTERLGDRFAAVRLSEIKKASNAKLADWKKLSLLMIYTEDLDKMGESFDADVAHRYRDGVIGNIVAAADRLAEAGFTYAVVVADHGHILIYELPAGAVQAKPQGQFVLEKRRAYLGKATSTPDGVMRISAERVGIPGNLPEIVFARGLGSFVASTAYYHEGLSLQECVVPVVSFRLKTATTSERPSVALAYKSEKFTSLVFQVTLQNNGLFDCTVAIEVVDPNAKGESAGSIGEFTHRDEHTGEIHLPGGTAIGVPVVVKKVSAKSVLIRVIDPKTGVEFATLTLKNEVMD